MDKGYPIDVIKEIKRYTSVESFEANEVVETFFKDGRLVRITRKWRDYTDKRMTGSESGEVGDEEMDTNIQINDCLL